jgi:hypothetical protein
MSACGKTTEQTKVVINTHEVAMGIETPVVKETPFANPVFIYGSSFGNFFQTLYKQGKFEDMLAFTSSESLKQFGKDKILNMYQKVQFGFIIKLKSQNTQGDTTVLNYEAGINATKNIVRISVVVENDSAKIVVSNLSRYWD